MSGSGSRRDASYDLGAPDQPIRREDLKLDKTVAKPPALGCDLSALRGADRARAGAFLTVTSVIASANANWCRFNCRDDWARSYEGVSVQFRDLARQLGWS